MKWQHKLNNIFVFFLKISGRWKKITKCIFALPCLRFYLKKKNIKNTAANSSSEKYGYENKQKPNWLPICQ